MNRFFFLLLCFGFLCSCSGPSLESTGGTEIELSSSQSINADDITSLVDRLKNFSSHPDAISFVVEGNNAKILAVGVTDTLSVKELITRGRMLKVVHAVPPSSYKKIQKYLSEYISSPSGDKPYKSKSMIGLVDDNNMAKVNEILASAEFKSMFPEAGQANFGVKKMNGKNALFIQDANSAVMDENMFEHLSAHEDSETGEGTFSLKLKDDYTDRISKLTGNDSTYLLHLFHDEVYISKIIKPHITSPSFGMAGAFTKRDAMVLAAIHNSAEVSTDLQLKKMLVHP